MRETSSGSSRFSPMFWRIRILNLASAQGQPAATENPSASVFALGVWPEEVSARIAKLGRRLGFTRDLDVLRQRIEMSWLPLLPEAEVAAIKPFRKQLKRERRLAFAELTDTLRSQRYLKLLSRLQVWIKAPVGTAMAAEPVRDWLPELQGQLIGDLFLLPGWMASEASEPGSAAALHELRKRLKTLR